jgi:hypothetical protein
MKRGLRRILLPEERKEVQGVVYRGVGEDMDCSKESFKVLGNRWSGACWGIVKGGRLEISFRSVFCCFHTQVYEARNMEMAGDSIRVHSTCNC